MGQDKKSAAPRLGDADLSLRLSRETYEERLSDLQKALLALQQAYRRADANAVIVFEGWDAAGKGGAIRRLAQAYDPRGLKVWPIAAPRPYFKERHYLARFWEKLPPDGTVAVFDRSWYGRVLVERVEGYATEAEWRRAYREIRDFEQLLTDDGARVIKFFLHISPKEQLERFEARLKDPIKRWKLTADDFRNRAKWEAYAEAIDEMFERTHTDAAPWLLIPAENKKYARIAVIEAVLERLSAGLELDPAPIDDELAAMARAHLGDARFDDAITS